MLEWFIARHGRKAEWYLPLRTFFILILYISFNLALRIWCKIKQYPAFNIFLFNSSPFYQKIYEYCMEMFLLLTSWGKMVEGARSRHFESTLIVVFTKLALAALKLANQNRPFLHMSSRK